MRRTASHTAAALVAAALGAGCTPTVPEEARPATAAVRPAVRRAAMDELPSLAEAPPRVEEMFITPLESVGSATASRLEVRFSEAELERLPGSIEFSPDDWQRVLLNDEGLDGDETAGDGLFSAELIFDFEQLMRDDERLDSLQDQLGDVVMPLLDCRRILERVPPIRLDRELLFSGMPIQLFSTGVAQAVSPDHSLFITKETVVEDFERTTTEPCLPQPGDSDKKWTFGYLMKRLAATHGQDPEDFVRTWLGHWQDTQTINEWSIPGRDAGGDILAQWASVSGAGGALEMDAAPFKLLAIVNRMDLAESSIYGSGTQGEARFIFGWVDEACNPKPFTVALEYLIPAQGCSGLKEWAQQWKDLDQHALGSPEYNLALEAITEQFAGDQVTLGQLRTGNAIPESGEGEEPWEMREFRIAEDGMLRQTTVVRTPDTQVDNTPQLASYINANALALSVGNHKVPPVWDGSAFLGGASLIPDASFFWQAPGVGISARHDFSLNTCNGCHSGETGTAFTHVDPATRQLSQFLMGFPAPGFPDPVDPTIHYEYGDLEVRASTMESLLGQQCLFRAFNCRPFSH